MPTTKQSPEVAAVVEEHGAYITLPKAATLLNCSRRTIGRMVDAGDLPLYAVGRTRTYRLRTEDVLALMRRVA